MVFWEQHVISHLWLAVSKAHFHIISFQGYWYHKVYDTFIRVHSTPLNIKFQELCWTLQTRKPRYNYFNFRWSSHQTLQLSRMLRSTTNATSDAIVSQSYHLFSHWNIQWIAQSAAVSSFKCYGNAARMEIAFYPWKWMEWRKNKSSFLDYKYWYVECQCLENWNKWNNVKEWSSIWPKSAGWEVKFLSTNNKTENQQLCLHCLRAPRRSLHQAV